MLKVSAFYLEKQKSFIPKENIFLSCCQCQNKKALFTDPIFSEGFESDKEKKSKKNKKLENCYFTFSCHILVTYLLLFILFLG